MMISANGFYERGPWEIDWHVVDEEFNDFAVQQLDSVGTLLFGRKTYEGMARYWPMPEAIAEDPDVARRMNATRKVVFSRTLERAEWENTRVARDAAAEVSRLKAAGGKDAIIFGSSDLAVSLSEGRLIDEYRLMVAPVALGAGKPLLEGLPRDLGLKLVGVRKFGSGNVLLTYEPSASFRA